MSWYWQQLWGAAVRSLQRDTVSSRQLLSSLAHSNCSSVWHSWAQKPRRWCLRETYLRKARLKKKKKDRQRRRGGRHNNNNNNNKSENSKVLTKKERRRWLPLPKQRYPCSPLKHHSGAGIFLNSNLWKGGENELFKCFLFLTTQKIF